MRQLGIGWEIGVPSGWGMYGLNLALELARRGLAPELFFFGQLRLTKAQQALLAPALERGHARQQAMQAGPLAVDFPLLVPLGDKLDLPGPVRGFKGAPTLGVPFIESAVIPKSNIAALQDFGGFITGSSWNTRILEAHGLKRVRFCPQGIDLGAFAPGEVLDPYPGRFKIFSGGKLEYRKGQDLVVAAFQRFQQRHPDALLVTAWHSPWPAAAAEIAKSPHIKGAPPVVEGRLDIAAWLTANGLPAGSFIDLGKVDHFKLPELLRAMDVAVMPSRSEGGTNLVAMEAMACGVPLILSRNTGHLDLIQGDNCYTLDFQIPIGEVTGRADLKDWGESSIDEMVAKLEAAYSDRADAARRGAAGAAFMKSWGWPEQVGKLLDAVADLS